MGGDEIWDAVSEHLGVGHDETTADGKITLERIECNAACDYAPVVMANWEFFDNQTPESTIELVDDLRAGKRRRARPAAPTSVCTFKEVSPRARRVPRRAAPTRASAPGRPPWSACGSRSEQGWTAPEGASNGGARAGIRPDRPPDDAAARRRAAPSVTPASDDANGDQGRAGRHA